MYVSEKDRVMRASPQPIPRLVHQTWKNHRVPSITVPWMRSWKDYHPHWQIWFWTDADNRRLLKEKCPWLLPLYDGYRHPVMRADLARYVILKVWGGVYADIDFECLQPIDGLLGDSALVLSREPEEHVDRWNRVYSERKIGGDIIGNSWMASVAEHLFWDELLDELLLRSQLKTPVEASGPFAVTAVWHSRVSWSGAKLLESEVLFPLTASQSESKESLCLFNAIDRKVAYAVHHWMGSWWGKKTIISRMLVRGKFLAKTTWMVCRRICQSAVLVAKQLVKKMKVGFQSSERYVPMPIEPPRSLTVTEKKSTLLLAVPIKNAAQFLPNFIRNLKRLTYPKHQLSLVFLESDSTDQTVAMVEREIPQLREHFSEVKLFRQSYSYRLDGARYGLNKQLTRRSIIARCRNRLLNLALADEAWVLWIDVDVHWWPDNVIECLLAEEKSILVPNCLNSQGNDFDLNSFCLNQKRQHPDWQQWLVDGLIQPPKDWNRTYLNALKSQHCVRLDSVGGTMLLVRSDIHRQGIVFPEYPYKQYIETEGFALCAEENGFTCWGLPNLEIVHT